MRSVPVIRCAAIATWALSAIVPTAAAKAPTLSYPAAKKAAQRKADEFAGKPTRLSSLYRVGTARYETRASWEAEDPDGCQMCGYDPVTGAFHDEPSTEYCSVEVVVRRRPSGHIISRVDSSSCF